MFKKIFTAGIIALGLVACNGTEPAHDEAEAHDHDDHNHDTEVVVEESAYTPTEGAHVHFGNLTDGDTVTSPFVVTFMVEGMTVNPAGELNAGTGHHHIIIDEAFTPAGVIVPADETHIHFGGGQTETELTLEPGMHTLTMQFANGIHQSYGEQMSATVTVFVK